MSDFNEAVEYVLSNEGGFVDNPNDPGGATNFGISLRLLRTLSPEVLKRVGIFKSYVDITSQDIEDLTEAQAQLIYKFAFWNDNFFNNFNDQRTVNYVFDMVVMHGFYETVKMLQRAIWAVNGRYEFANVIDDGIYGKKTEEELSYVNEVDLKIALISERAGYMRLLAATNPKEKDFLTGWLKRCYKI